jgi:hypothetical protein
MTHCQSRLHAQVGPEAMYSFAAESVGASLLSKLRCTVSGLLHICACGSAPGSPDVPRQRGVLPVPLVGPA